MLYKVEHKGSVLAFSSPEEIELRRRHLTADSIRYYRDKTECD